MKKPIQSFLFLFLSAFSVLNPCYAIDIPGVKGDGIHDDTKGLQALLDSKASTVYLPRPAKCYLISKTLKIYSGQTLMVDRDAVIRLADRAGAHLLTNADHTGGNSRITVIGGIWDGNNLTQTTAYHEDRNNKSLPYDPDRYLGVLMMFNNVKDLHITGVTFKDPEMFAFLGGNLFQFTIENVTFDFNMRRGNMDGIHIFGPSSHGRIVNLKGATNDDLIALNADDIPLVEPDRGPITDILVDGLWAENCYTAVRINSCGSPVKRIKISNIFGTYRYYIVQLSNHKVHPDCVSEFEDISVSGVFCSNAANNTKQPHFKIWSPASVSNFSISDCHRTETVPGAADNILIEKGARIKYLSISNVSLFNQCNEKITLVNNQGTIGVLHFSNVFLQSKEPEQIQLLDNTGEIKLLNKTDISINGQTETDHDVSSEMSAAVVPVQRDRVKQNHKAGKDETQCRRILSNAVRYNLAWINSTFKEDKARGLYVIERFDEHGVRPAASVCYAAAVALQFAKMNGRELGVSPETALAMTEKMIKGVAAAYIQNSKDGKGWGNAWQSAFWATMAGQGAWLLWDELDPETRTMVAGMVVAEADRFIVPDYKVPYWISSDGTVNTPGDTKAEENAWNAGILSLAVAMMPQHPHGDAWKKVCSELIISAFATKNDLQNKQIMDGRPVMDWLQGYNVGDDGVVVNHNLTHPDYTVAITLNSRSYLIQPLAGQKVFEGSLMNFPLIFRSLTERVWTSPPFVQPGGTIYIPGKAEIYYPQNTDWSRLRFDIFYLMDVNMHVFNLDRGLQHKAAEWLHIRADRIEAMQKRHSDGKMFAPNEYPTYPGCNQMTAWQLADAYLLFRLYSKHRHF